MNPLDPLDPLVPLNPLVPFEPVRWETVPQGDDWLHQVKWDGVRVLAYATGAQKRLFNRKRRERTLHYPELVAERICNANSYVVDGEIIALDADGKPSFHAVMRRDGLRRMERVREVEREVPIVYMVFDLLYCDGTWLFERPLEDRLDILERIIEPSRNVQFVTSHSDGAALFAAVRDHGMEGIVSKRLGRSYAPNGKDDRWVKVKNYGSVKAVIGGFTLNGGTVNAVLLGLYDEQNRLRFIGKAGTGTLTRNDWRQLTDGLAAIRTAESPFADRHPDMKGAHWVRPAVVVDVRYSEWRRHEGRLLRQPSIRGFVDMAPERCMLH